MIFVEYVPRGFVKSRERYGITIEWINEELPVDFVCDLKVEDSVNN